jgi:putative NIF3 family GTP cyclohydrolase 1 type 2
MLKMKIKEVVTTIISATDSTGVEPDKTNDQIIIGDRDQEVRGIVTTFMATIDVIKQAIKLNANLIITHEPTWFNGRDQTDWLENDDIYLEKAHLIQSHNIVIWRFHDYMHRASEDLIYKGFDQLLDWGSYKINGNQESSNPLEQASLAYAIPQTDLGSLLSLFKEKLNMPVIRFIGHQNTPVKKVGLLLGGSSLGLGDETNPMKLIRRKGIDTIICGDIFEWTIASYIRDALMLGKPLSMIVIGHNRSEEEGMKYIVPWIESLVPDTPVTFVEAGDPFNYFG